MHIIFEIIEYIPNAVVSKTAKEKKAIKAIKKLDKYDNIKIA